MNSSRLLQAGSVLRGLPRRANGPAVRAATLVATTVHMCLRNLLGRSPVTGGAACVVSLASYGPRKRSAFLAVESIGRGALRPARLILWLDEVDARTPLPRSLRRLRSRGLEVRYTDADLGPHKKYYPYVASDEEPRLTLVTADDDVIYSREWLQGLDRATASFTSDDIVCYRAYQVKVDGESIAPYAEWPSCTTDSASLSHFATGVSGVAYPASFQRVLRAAGTAFRDVCPRADDVWLHVNAVRSGSRVRQVSATRQNFRQIIGTQGSGLMNENVGHGGNDAQIRATYTPEDIAVMAGGSLSATR